MVVSSPSLAILRGLAPTGAPTGTAILNGFNSVANGDFPYKNLILGAPNPQGQTGTNPFPTWLDANGYPLANPAGRAVNISCGQVPVPLSWTGNYILGWAGKGEFVLDRGAPGYTIISGSGFVSGGTGFSIIALGTNGRIVFKPTTSAISNIPFYFVTATAGAFDGTLSGLYLCRDNGVDEADILSGDTSRMFNNDFLSSVGALNPYAIRVMDMCNTNNSNVSQPYTLRRPLASFSFGTTETTGVGSHWPLSCWAGAITGTTDTYTCGAAPSTPGSWTHGETFQGQFGASVANTVYSFSAAANNGSGLIRLTVTGGTAGLTTGQPIALGFGAFGTGTIGNWLITVVGDGTHIDLTTNLKSGAASVFSSNTSGQFTTATINVNSRGAKLLCWGANGGGGSLSSGGQLVANAICTFVYDADLDAVLVGPPPDSGQQVAGLASGPPIEVVVALANKLNVGLWYCFPVSTLNAEVTSIVSYVSANLRATLPGYFEFGNEIWNGLFGQTGLSAFKGINLNFTQISGRNIFGYYGLRVAQIMPLVTTAWGARGGLHTVLASQGQVGVGIGFPTPLYRLQGQDLTSSGNAVYGASSISGGVAHNTSPTRPVDVCTDLAYATYYSGAQLANADSSYQLLLTISGTGQLLDQANNYVNGNPTQQAAALAFADNDIRNGTVAPLVVSSNNFPTTPFTFSFPSTPYFGFPLPLFVGSTVYLTASGGTLPGGLSAGTPYYVTACTATTCQISATLGGSAVSPSSAGTGTVSLNFTSASTLVAFDTGSTSGVPLGIYPSWETVAASYDSGRIANGQPKLAVSLYEGGCEIWSVTPSRLQALGAPKSTIFTSSASGTFIGTVSGGHNLAIGDPVILNTNNQMPVGLVAGLVYYVVSANYTSTTFSLSASAGGAALTITSAGAGTLVVSQEAANVYLLIVGYKNSALFKQTVLDQFNQMMGTFAASANFGLLTHSKHPNWYQFGGGSQWSLLSGDLYSTPWQSYGAFQQYNGH